ncbi:MAG: 4Fe-4S dicluster domain-containing protein [Promethearchaeota archaeon]
MTNSKYYEIVRSKLKLEPFFTPKHKLVFEIMKILWNEEEIKILSYFESADKSISLRKLTEKSGIPKNEIKKILGRSVENGTISKIGNKYGLKPLTPGVFEKYYINRKDSKENQIKLATLFREYIDEIVSSQMIESNFKIFRPLLPYGAKEKLIKIDESINVPKFQVLPYELVEFLINKNNIFATIPCYCRLIGEYSGNPCKVASHELGCLFGGDAAQHLINTGVGKQITKKDAIDLIIKAEKAGLIHTTVADNSLACSLFICNCCSCHCILLKPTKEYQLKTVNPSNFLAKIDNEFCVKCENCLKKCQMGAIFHQWPNEPDSSDEHMFVKEDFCIGCGICASNCPKSAIKIVKVRNDDFSKKVKYGNKPALEIFI